jgi:hypothetical protein
MDKSWKDIVEFDSLAQTGHFHRRPQALKSSTSALVNWICVVTWPDVETMKVSMGTIPFLVLQTSLLGQRQAHGMNLTSEVYLGKGGDGL